MFKKHGKETKSVVEQSNESSIIARVISEKEGLRVFKDIKGIRIKSEKYHLLIMSDYVPSLGEIKGEVTLIGKDEEIVIRNISAFYKLQHNEFTLLID